MRAAQLRALRDYASKNRYIVACEYVDEAESGRIADRPRRAPTRGAPTGAVEACIGHSRCGPDQFEQHDLGHGVVG